MLLENFYSSVLAYIDSKLSSRYWLWQLTLFAVVVSLFLAFPPYTLLIDHFAPGGTKLDAWVFINNQAVDLFNPKDITYDVRRENMIFRWFLPLLSYLTNHNIILILLLQGTLGVLFIYNIGKNVYALCQDKITTFLFVLAISNIFVSVWAFADIHGYGDGFAFFFLLIAMFNGNPLIGFVLLQLAFFTDERAVIAGGYLLLWQMVMKAYQQNDFRLSVMLKSAVSGHSRVIWVAWAVYLSVRFYVHSAYFQNHHYSTLGTPVLFADAHRFGLGSSLWASFEGMWVLLAGAALALWLTKRYMLLFALFVGFSVLIASGIFVHDIDRALAYGFPFLLIALFILLKTSSLKSIRLLLFFTAFICVIHPQIYYMGYNRILWLEPLPLKVFMLIDQIMEWNMFN